MVEWKLVYTNQALKDAKKISNALAKEKNSNPFRYTKEKSIPNSTSI